MFNFKRYTAIVKKEILQLKRDKISSKIPFVMPIMMMFLFGYVVNTEVSHIKTGVLDQSKTQLSRAYIDKFRSTGYFLIEYDVGSEQELEALLDRGKIKAGITIPATFANDIKQGKCPSVLLSIDGSDSTVAQTVLGSGILIAQNVSIENLTRQLKKAGDSQIDIEGTGISTRVLYNPNMEIRYFTIPGLVGLIMMNITIMLTAFAMVREKERGTIEQLIVTPIRANELILGKLTPYIVVGYAGFLFSLGICRFYFKIPILGNIVLLLLLGALFVICCLSVGMLISTFAKNQFQAMMMVMMAILPSILLSGFMFPIEAMPAPLQAVTNLIPLTYFLRIIRGILLKGVGIEALWLEAAALCAFMIVVLSMAIVRFRKSLD